MRSRVSIVIQSSLGFELLPHFYICYETDANSGLLLIVFDNQLRDDHYSLLVGNSQVIHLSLEISCENGRYLG